MEHKYRILISFLLLFHTTVAIQSAEYSSVQNNSWTAYILYSKENRVPVLKEPTDEADTLSFVFYLDKLLIVDEEWGKFGWKKVVYPVNGFINERFLITPTEKIEIAERYNYPAEENEFSKWDWEIISCGNKYVLVKEKMDQASSTNGLLAEGENLIIVKDQIYFQGIWSKTVYPYKGYVKYTDVTSGMDIPYLALGISYGAYHLPYEKNLKNYFNPIGGYLEYSNTNWNTGFRLGYNYTESRLTTWYLKTNQIYFHLVYRFFSIFNKKLDVYLLAGGNYWFLNFQNIKYGTDNSYFRLEKATGLGYVLGGGLIYYLNNFYIEAQYNFFGSEEAEFGRKPVEGEFRSYNTLYPGSNHVEVILGYKFVF